MRYQFCQYRELPWWKFYSYPGLIVGRSDYVLKDKPVKKLFHQYEKAFNALEVEKQVPFFAEHFISAGPRGSIAQSRDEFAKMAHQAAEFYRKIGQTSARILSADETPVSHEYSMVKVHWGVRSPISVLHTPAVKL